MAEEDRDILGKADALLRRHVPPRASPGEGADIPVLTELITPGGVAPPSPPAPEAAGAGEPESDAELVDKISRAVQSRLEHELERRLILQVTADVQTSVTAALEELRGDIAEAVRDAVTEALAGRRQR